MAAIELALERDPYRFSRAFDSEERRLCESDDPHDATTLMAFVIVDPKAFVCEIKWLAWRPFDGADEEDDEAEDTDGTS